MDIIDLEALHNRGDRTIEQIHALVSLDLDSEYKLVVNGDHRVEAILKNKTIVIVDIDGEIEYQDISHHFQ